MKYTTIVLATLAAVVSAQTDNIPSCAQPCIDAAVTGVTTCGETDYACQCTTANQNLIQNNATSCVLSACGAAAAAGTYLQSESLSPLMG